MWKVYFFMGQTTSKTPSIDNPNANLLEHDNEAVPLCESQWIEWTNFLNQCLPQNKQLHIFIVDHLLSKLYSDICKVYVCMSPVDCVGLPYF